MNKILKRQKHRATSAFNCRKRVSMSVLSVVSLWLILAAPFFAQLALSAQQSRMTEEQRSAYERGLRDPYVLHLRKALNGYLDGTNVGIIKPDYVIKYKCGGVPSGLDCFSKDYFKSKFVVFHVADGVLGGKVISIVFQDKPDRLFVAWVRRFGDGSYDLSGFWQNQTFDKEVMEIQFSAESLIGSARDKTIIEAMKNLESGQK